MVIKHSLYDESPTIEVDRDACKGCKQCTKTCPSEVLSWDGDRVSVGQNSHLGCIACGHCMMVCPEGAIRVWGRGISPEDLLDLPPREVRASAEALQALFRGRRSVRRFKEEEIPLEMLERVVEAAASAPMGIPPWDVGVSVLMGREKVQALAEEIVKGYEGFLRIFRPWFLVLMRPVLGRAKYEMFKTFIRPLARSIVSGRREGRDHLFWDAPALMIFHHSPYAGEIDANIACTHAMLAAESLGLGTTVIGSAPPILQRSKKLLGVCGIPPGNTPSQALILGYPAVRFRRAVRRGFTQVRFA